MECCVSSKLCGITAIVHLICEDIIVSDGGGLNCLNSGKYPGHSGYTD